MTSPDATTAPVRLVLVDQNDLLLDMLSTCLGHLPGIAIAGRARSGVEGIALVGTIAPDAVLLNLTLPDMSGLTAMRRIKSLPHAPLVIMMTFHSSHAAMETIRGLGADDCILKSEVARAAGPAIERLMERCRSGGPGKG
jgi:DNA-binding NarL/FixJ family response regulator